MSDLPGHQVQRWQDGAQVCTSCHTICVGSDANADHKLLKLGVASRQQQALHCERCERTFSASKGVSQYVDLTPLSGFEGKVYKQTNWGGTTLFECGCCCAGIAACSTAMLCMGSDVCFAVCRTPIMSYIYERGYRQNFQW